MTLAFWICAAVTVISAAVSFGYSVAGLRSAPAPERVGLMYAFARSLALLVVAIIALFAGSTAFVAAIAIAMVVVQAADAVIGVRIRDTTKTVGPAATAVMNLGVLIWMLAV